uniref:Uncharacterized protein n=1 Tax=Ditylenchus dipsaci TaxID=166011 RepID=A0A915E8J6_9BILA
MEMATKEVASPIKQDEKGGKPRFVHNIFPSTATFGIMVLCHKPGKILTTKTNTPVPWETMTLSMWSKLALKCTIEELLFR